MGSLTSRITWELLRSVNATALTGVYVPLGGPLAFPSYKCKLVNNSTSLVTISVDGVNAVDVAPAGSFWLYDESSNVPGVMPPPSLPQGTQIYINGVAGTGLIYLVSQYLLPN